MDEKNGTGKSPKFLVPQRIRREKTVRRTLDLPASAPHECVARDCGLDPSGRTSMPAQNAEARRGGLERNCDSHCEYSPLGPAARIRPQADRCGALRRPW